MFILNRPLPPVSTALFGGLFFIVKINLIVWEENFVRSKGVGNDSQSVATGLELIHGVTGDLELVIK